MGREEEEKMMTVKAKRSYEMEKVQLIIIIMQSSGHTI